jgi:hypothetical protein
MQAVCRLSRDLETVRTPELPHGLSCGSPPILRRRASRTIFVAERTDRRGPETRSWLRLVTLRLPSATLPIGQGVQYRTHPRATQPYSLVRGPMVVRVFGLVARKPRRYRWLARATCSVVGAGGIRASRARTESNAGPVVAAPVTLNDLASRRMASWRLPGSG